MKSLQSLSESGLVWRANSPYRSSLHINDQSRSTGFEELDRALMVNGWPNECVLELILPKLGVGELSLFLPWLGRVAQQSKKKIAFISPPFLPSPAALMAYGISPQQIWLLSPKGVKDQLWAQQQCLIEGQCLAVFMWHDEKASDTSLRKLQLAAKQGGCLGISIRPISAEAMPSPAPYRMTLKPNLRDLHQVTILKRRGGWRSAPLLLDLKSGTNPKSSSQAINLA